MARCLTSTNSPSFDKNQMLTDKHWLFINTNFLNSLVGPYFGTFSNRLITYFIPLFYCVFECKKQFHFLISHLGVFTKKAIATNQCGFVKQ